MITREHCASIVEVASKRTSTCDADAEIRVILKDVTDKNRVDFRTGYDMFNGTPLEYMFLMPACRRPHVIMNVMIIAMRHGFLHPHDRPFCVVGSEYPFQMCNGDSELKSAILRAYLAVRYHPLGIGGFSDTGVSPCSLKLRNFICSHAKIPSRLEIRAFMDSFDPFDEFKSISLAPAGEVAPINKAATLPADDLEDLDALIMSSCCLESSADAEQQNIRTFYEAQQQQQNITPKRADSPLLIDYYEDDLITP